MTKVKANPVSNDPLGTFLIVDDNRDIVELLERTLKAHTPYSTFKAHNGAEAFEILNSQQVDVIILDMLMPGMTGIECFRKIRERPIYIPVIFLTGRGDDELKKAAMQLGAFDFLEKPTRARELLLLIDEAFKTVTKVRNILSRTNLESTNTSSVRKK